MSIAVKEAKMGLIKNEVPVGTVITYYDKIISSNHNRVILDMDPSAHAEILCIRDATKKLQTLFLNECSLYTTLEPCVMCAQAIAFSKIKRLYFGAYNIKFGSIENGVRLFNANVCNHIPEIYGGINEEDSIILMKNFFTKKRKGFITQNQYFS